MTDWLNKFQQGGQIDKAAKQLVSLIGRAYKEIQSGKPGQATQQLLQVMKDPQGGQMLSNLAQQMPQVGEALGAITKALQEMMGEAQSMEKGGEMIPEESKGGSAPCPCATHKKLFRIGGKICQITVDCEGNIVSE